MEQKAEIQSIGKMEPNRQVQHLRDHPDPLDKQQPWRDSPPCIRYHWCYPSSCRLHQWRRNLWLSPFRNAKMRHQWFFDGMILSQRTGIYFDWRSSHTNRVQPRAMMIRYRKWAGMVICLSQCTPSTRFECCNDSSSPSRCNAFSNHHWQRKGFKVARYGCGFRVLTGDEYRCPS